VTYFTLVTLKTHPAYRQQHFPIVTARQELLRLSTIAFAVVGKVITSFPSPAMQYRVKYTIWRIEARSAAEAKRKVIELLRSSPEYFISVEVDNGLNRRPLWKLFLLGR